MQYRKIERKVKHRADWEKTIKELNVPYNNNNNNNSTHNTESTAV
jgi:hypothetical protein